VKLLVAHLTRIPKDENLPLQYWVIDGLPKVGGKRQRKFFRTKDAALGALASIKTKLRKEGEKALLIPDAVRIEALECGALLAPYNASLTDAVRFFVAHKHAAQRSCTVQAATDEYLKLQRRNQRSARHLDDLKYRLRTFKDSFGEKLMSALSVHELEEWLHGLGLSPKSTNNYHSVVSSLFSFALKRGYAGTNPLAAIDKMRIPAKAPGILSPLQCQKLLSAAGARVLPLIAIQAFCGVRNAEILRLSWSDIDMARGFVHIAAEQAKGARRRLVEMPENLKTWLLPYVGRAGKLWSWSHVEYYLELKAARANAGIRKWPSNALRHSYASYHLAFHQNAAALALQMGHTSQTMIFSNYREVVTPDEAQRYWSVKPSSGMLANVIPMEAWAK
jgi:integrase